MRVGDVRLMLPGDCMLLRLACGAATIADLGSTIGSASSEDASCKRSRSGPSASAASTRPAVKTEPLVELHVELSLTFEFSPDSQAEC